MRFYIPLVIILLVIGPLFLFAVKLAQKNGGIVKLGKNI
jgi:hypothetical protein